MTESLAKLQHATEDDKDIARERERIASGCKKRQGI